MKPCIPIVTLIFGVLVRAASAEGQAAEEPTKTSVPANGLVADVYIPAGAKGRLPAIIILGGSPFSAPLLEGCDEHRDRAANRLMPIASDASPISRGGLQRPTWSRFRLTVKSGVAFLFLRTERPAIMR